MLNKNLDSEDFKLLFTQFPGRYTVYTADHPKFTIVKMSDELLADLDGKKEDFEGKGLFEAFPANPNDPKAEEDKKSYLLLLSIAIEEKKELHVPIQRYDIKNAQTGIYEERYWANVFNPIIDNEGKVRFLINSSTDLTEVYVLKEREKKFKEEYQLHQQMMMKFFQQAPVAIAIYTGPEFIVKLANPVFGAIVGRNVEDILNKSIFESIPEVESDYRDLHERVLFKGESIVGREQLAHLNRNGKIEDAYFDYVYEPMLEEDGSISGVFTVAIEVTPQVLLRKKIEENEKRLKFSIQASKMGTWEIDLEKDETIKYFRHDEKFGQSEHVENCNIENFLKHIHKEDMESVKSVVKTVHSEPFRLEARYSTSRGNIKWIEISGMPDSGGTGKMFGVIADITERKTLELQKEEYLKLLKGYNKELEELTQAKDRFISIISHDLRNPLSVITASSDIILQNIEDLGRKDTKKLVEVINNSSKKVGAQLGELVALAQSKDKKAVFNPIEKSLREFVDISIQMLESLASHKHISIKNRTPVNLEIYADPLMMQSILQNLISNAIKFTPDGGYISIYGKVRENEEDFLEIKVVDSGIGMPEDVVKLLFDENQTVTTSGTEEEKGSGFGLKLVKDFVRKQGGNIWVESSPGKGSCFTFTVPRAKPKRLSGMQHKSKKD